MSHFVLGSGGKAGHALSAFGGGFPSARVALTLSHHHSGNPDPGAVTLRHERAGGHAA